MRINFYNYLEFIITKNKTLESLFKLKIVLL